MSALDLAVFFGLMAALSWGLSDFFGARISKAAGPINSVLVSTWLETPMYILILLISGKGWHVNESGFMYAAAAGVVFSLATAFFFIALEAGPVSLVSPISSTYPLVTTLIAIIAFKANLTLVEVIGIALIIAGVTIASGVIKAVKKKHQLSKGVKLAILIVFVWGLGFALLAQAVKRISWIDAGLIEIVISSIITSLFVAPLLKGKEVISFSSAKKTITNPYVWLSSTIGLSGLVFVSIAFSKSSANGGAVPTAVSSIYPVLTMVLAIRAFKEKVEPLALAGALVGIAGVLVLSL